MNTYLFSPEFHRNLWIRFSWLKLIAPPLLIALFGMGIFNIVEGDMNAFYGKAKESSLFFATLILFIWGNYEAGNALKEEVVDKTWDLQKLSAQGPGQLSFGKLFGTSSYVWYTASFTIGVFVWSFMHHIPCDAELIPTLDNPLLCAAGTGQETLFILASLVLAAVFGHSFAFLMSLTDASRVTNKRLRNYIPASKGPAFFGLIISYTVFAYLAWDMAEKIRLFRHQKLLRPETTDWYGYIFNNAEFLFVSTCFFALCVLIGIYRQTRSELGYRTTPLGWMAFSIALAAYMGGHVPPGLKIINYNIAVLSNAFIVLLLCTYLPMLAECTDRQKYKRFWNHMKHNRLALALENVPRWVANLPLVIGALLALGLYSFLRETANIETRYIAFILFLTMFLFTVRDGLVLHTITNDRMKRRNVRFLIFFYYLLAYLALPMLYFAKIFTVMKGSVKFILNGEPVNFETASAAAWFYPIPFMAAKDTLIPVVVQIILATLIFYMVVRKDKEQL